MRTALCRSSLPKPTSGASTPPHAVGTTTQAGTLVAAGDRKLIVSALDDAGAPLPEPKHGDQAQVGAKLYTVRNVDPLSPGGVVVLYNLIVGA
jgi:hypothetical protein